MIYTALSVYEKYKKGVNPENVNEVVFRIQFNWENVGFKVLVSYSLTHPFLPNVSSIVFNLKSRANSNASRSPYF